VGFRESSTDWNSLLIIIKQLLPKVGGPQISFMWQFAALRFADPLLFYDLRICGLRTHFFADLELLQIRPKYMTVPL
jgi:hypothetical protein